MGLSGGGNLLMVKESYESLKVPANAHGEALKQLQIKFVNMLPNLNDEKDRAALMVSARKARIEDITAEAIMHIKDSEEFKATKSTVQSKVLNAMVRNYEAEVEYQEALDKDSVADKVGNAVKTTVSIEEHRLNIDQFKFSRAKSRCEELDQLLWVCRSGLSFDKSEMNHNTGT